jgi:hypothetical protein
MGSSTGHLTQSRFYSTAFNAAVFDGPIRIYFAQHQEALALQVYHRMQQHLKESYVNFRQSFRRHGQNIFLMLYPSAEAFAQAFPDGVTDAVVGDRLNQDHVVGVRGPLPDEDYFEVFARLEFILQDLGVSPESPAPLA